MCRGLPLSGCWITPKFLIIVPATGGNCATRMLWLTVNGPVLHEYQHLTNCPRSIRNWGSATNELTLYGYSGCMRSVPCPVAQFFNVLGCRRSVQGSLDRGYS